MKLREGLVRNDVACGVHTALVPGFSLVCEARDDMVECLSGVGGVGAVFVVEELAGAAFIVDELAGAVFTVVELAGAGSCRR